MGQPQHGAHLIGNGKVMFALWAPDLKAAGLELEDGEVRTMAALPDGWFVHTEACEPGTLYRFVTDDGTRVPDPASRQQADCLHGYSVVTDPDSYPWRETGWRGRPWHESIICEVHVGLLGGFKGLASWLPWFQQLGVTAIELMPLGHFPGERNWGYDVALPFAPDSSYGTPDELKALVDAAHSHGLMVYVDVIYNHFGPTGNYLPHYASQYFNDDEETPWGPAIDFSRRPVREFFIQNALMWVQDYRMDGLRLDAVHAIKDRGFLMELLHRVRGAVTDREVHLMIENQHNTVSLLEEGFDGQWNDDMHHTLHTILTNEDRGYYRDFAEDRTEKLLLCLTRGFAYQEGNDEALQALPPWRFICYLQNHDQIGNRAFGERLLTLADEHRVWAAAAMLLLSPMTPMFFMGEEIGSRQPFRFFTDHEPHLAEAVRQGRCEEFAALPGFKASANELPDPEDVKQFLVSYPYHNARPDGTWDPAEQRYLLRFREVLKLRHTHLFKLLADNMAADEQPGITKSEQPDSNELTETPAEAGRSPRTRTPHVRSVAARRLGRHAVSAHWRVGDHRLMMDVNLGEDEVALPYSNLTDAGNTLVIYAFRVDTQRLVLLPGSLLVRMRRMS